MKSSNIPELACDCHIHILDENNSHINGKDFSNSASWQHYRQEANAAGLQRAVIIQPSFYGFDNSLLLQTLQQNKTATRGIIVIPKDINQQDLKKFHDLGVRGIRFNTISGGLDISELNYYSKLIKPLGWHIQIYLDSSRLPDLMPELISLDVDVVLDHMAHVDCNNTDQRDSGFDSLLTGLDTGKIWVKLSNALFAPDIDRGIRLVERRPDRLVWASDWPHVIYKGEPDPISELVKLCTAYTDKKDIINKVLVENPDKLYFW